MAVVLITGGTGLIGRALSQALLEKNYQVIVLTRNPSRISNESPHIRYAGWNPDQQTIDLDTVAKADYLVHLAGEGIADKRWTKKRREEIRSSRVKSGEFIVQTLLNNPNKVRAVVSASAIGWYGEDPEIPNPRPFREEDPADKGFLGSTCEAWEQSLEPLTNSSIRLVKLRTGIVLSRDGGALPEFMKPVKYGVGAIFGSGKQRISWIHIDDLVRAYIMAIENDGMRGVYNAVAPNPVSNREFMLNLAHILKGRFHIPVYIPAGILKLVLGKLSIEILKSTTVSADKLHYSGFTFLYPSVEAALRQLIQDQPAKMPAR